MSVSNILCLICINHGTSEIMLHLTITRGFCSICTQDIQRKNIDHQHMRLVQTKFNMGTICLDNHHRSFGPFGSWGIAQFNTSWLNWAQQSISMRFSWSMYEILWRYTICCNDSKLNNLQELDLDCLATSIPVQWTRAHAGERQRGVNSVLALCPAETGSCCSIMSHPENWPPNSLDLKLYIIQFWGCCNRWCIVTKFQTLTS